MDNRFEVTAGADSPAGICFIWRQPAVVDQVAEIPRAIRAGATVRRVS